MVGVSNFTIQANPTFKDLKGRFARAEKGLIKTRRDQLREEGRFLVGEIRQGIQTKVGKPSKIEAGVRFETREVGKGIRLKVSAPARAKPHRIQAVNAKALGFPWAKVGMFTIVPRRGGFKTHVRNGNYLVGKGFVDHPGGSLEPLVGPIVKDVSTKWARGRGQIALRKISTRYVQGLSN